MVDDAPWQGRFDMAWPPTFSPDGAHVAAVAEKSGRFHVLVDGKSFERSFERAWPPVFSPDSRKVLIRAVENNSYVRIVADLAQF